MTENTETATTTAAQRNRREMKFNPDTQVASIEGIGNFDASALPEDVRKRLMGVGLITIMARVKKPMETFAEMQAGTWDQRGEAAPKPLTDWQKAIAAVRVDERVRAKRVGGEKVTPTDRQQMVTDAEAWVRTLSTSQITDLKKIRDVRTKHAEMTSEQRSLDDVLNAPAPQAGDAVKEAAE